jgi:thiamine-monophosphate kinase
MDLFSLPIKSNNRTLNEEETIQLIWKVLSRKKRKRISSSFDPFSDDVCWFRNLRNRKFVVSKADILVADTDAPPQMSPRQIASKAITAAVSDFAAKGVKPSFCIVSLAIPKKKATYSFIRSLALGFDNACKRYQMKLLSGDTSGSIDGLVIDVSAFGFANSIVKRSGSKPGETVGVSGRFGLQSAGLAILLRNAKSNDSVFRRKAKLSVLDPVARLSLGLKTRKYLTSCIDSSDGLALSLYHIGEASKVDVQLDSLPIARGVSEFATQNKLKSDDLVLFGGEEYELIMTYKVKYAKTLEKFGVITIGRTSKAGNRGPTVYFRSRKISRKGWIHNQ